MSEKHQSNQTLKQSLFVEEDEEIEDASTEAELAPVEEIGPSRVRPRSPDEETSSRAIKAPRLASAQDGSNSNAAALDDYWQHVRNVMLGVNGEKKLRGASLHDAFPGLVSKKGYWIARQAREIIRRCHFTEDEAQGLFEAGKHSFENLKLGLPGKKKHTAEQLVLYNDVESNSNDPLLEDARTISSNEEPGTSLQHPAPIVEPALRQADTPVHLRVPSPLAASRQTDSLMAQVAKSRPVQPPYPLPQQEDSKWKEFWKHERDQKGKLQEELFQVQLNQVRAECKNQALEDRLQTLEDQLKSEKEMRAKESKCAEKILRAQADAYDKFIGTLHDRIRKQDESLRDIQNHS